MPNHASLTTGFAWIGILCLAMSQLSIAATAEPIRIGATRTAILVWLADELGYLRDADLRVEAMMLDSGTQAARDIKAGEIDLATSSEFAFVSNAFERRDLRILASLSASRTTDFVARADRGIETLDDLTGKRIAVTRLGIGQYFLGRHLTLTGLTLADIDVVHLPPKGIVDAIVDGSVDAGLTWEPYVYQASHRLGDNHLILPGQGGQDFFFLLYTTEGWLRDNRAAAEALLRALVLASDQARDQPERAKGLVGKRLGFDDAFIDHLWPKHRLAVSLSQDLLRIMEDEAEWRMANGLSDAAEIPNYLEMIESDPLVRIDPAAVTIFGSVLPALGVAGDAAAGR